MHIFMRKEAPRRSDLLRLWRHLTPSTYAAVWQFHLQLDARALTDEGIDLFIDEETDSPLVSLLFLCYIQTPQVTLRTVDHRHRNDFQRHFLLITSKVI